MAWFRLPFKVAILLLTTFVWTTLAQENAALNALFDRDDAAPEALICKAKTGEALKFGEMPLDGRSLIASWLGKRQSGCINSGYSPCTSSYGCCPTGDNCCDFGCCKSGKSCCPSGYCADQGDTCCTIGTCPSGWGCCALGTCYPLGGECCSNGNYCEPGNKCFLVNGLHRCCTDSHCTAHVSGSVTVTAAGYGGSGTTRTLIQTTTPLVTLSSEPTASIPPPPSVTRTTLAVTAEPSTVAVFQYYYFTITWWYYSWYWTFSTFQSRTSTESTYTRIDTSTVVSVYETDSASARASFRSISATFSSPTPVAATQLSTLPSQTSQPSQSRASSLQAASSAVSTSSGTGTASSQSGGSGGTKLNAGWGVSGVTGAFLLAGLTSGLLMLVL